MFSQPPAFIQTLLHEAKAGMNNPADRDLALQAALHALQSLSAETAPDEAAALIQQVTDNNGPATAFAITLIVPILVGAQKGDIKLPGQRTTPPKHHKHQRRSGKSLPK
jgi:hypothetical protein